MSVLSRSDPILGGRSWEEFLLSKTSRTILQLAATSSDKPYIDLEAFLNSAIRYGQFDGSASARWLFQLVEERGSTSLLSPLSPLPKTITAVGANQTLEPMLFTAFRRAERLRARTGGQDRFVGLRLLLYGIATEPTCLGAANGFFASLRIELTWFRSELVTLLHGALEPGESWDTWLQIFAEDGVAAPASQSSSPPPNLEAEAPPAVAESPDGPQRLAAAYGNARAISPTETDGTLNADISEAEAQFPSSDLKQTAADPPPPLTPTYEDRVPTQSDDPAIVDQLQRKGFAGVLAEHMANFRKTVKAGSETGAFMMLVDGPWGAGKSSVLHLLTEELRRDQATPWVIITFNAWRYQRTRPPWWSLIKQIYVGAYDQLRTTQPSRAALLRRRWRLWNFRHVWSSAVAGIAFVLLTLFSLIAFEKLRKIHPSLNVLDSFLKVVSGAAAIGATCYGLAQAYLFGSSKAAQSLADLRNDPMQPVVSLFTSLYDTIGLPLAVYIDDLDRCTSDFVVELLEGIQTLLRTRPLVYVVAADRKWICTSYEKTYIDFGGAIGEPGRPLGYLFLDKVFQLTATLPRIAGPVQQSFWEGILAMGSGPAPAAADETVRQKAEQQVAHLTDQDALLAEVESAQNNPTRRYAIQAAAARRITQADAQQATEHRLRRFADLLESNPRSIKRLANAYSLHQASGMLQGRKVPAAALARWTILELRWPLLTDFLSQHPEASPLLQGELLPSDVQVPENLKSLLTNKVIRNVACGRAELGEILHEQSVREVLGFAVAPAESAAPAAQAA